MSAGTEADRSATFKIYFDKMRDGVARFRKHINFES
jgi:hypothetical protein